MDSLSPERRSWNMSRIKNRDTKPEILVRSLLHRMGYRFRLHRKDLPGKPDVVLPRHKTIILVHGCFWHQHKECRYAYTPKSRVDFWQKKFNQNVKRDQKVQTELLKLGWKVYVVWECETKKPELLVSKLQRILEG
jgi:DNA mismatch endonuclease (patch repair protein)